MISIIVPIYNSEKTLERCVDSILNQEYTDLELILVNDGSNDASPEICDKYAKIDTRVQVIHKKNSGVSDTRNCGIKAARGEYIQFVDADDWITPDATKLLARAMKENQSELVVADFYRVVGKRISHKGSIKEEGMLTREDFAEYMKDDPADFYYGVLWNKLYRRDVIEKYHIQMDEKISWCEDFIFNLEYLLHIKTVYVLQAPIYYYLKTEGSLVSQAMSVSKTVRTKFQVFEYYYDFYKDIYMEKESLGKKLGVYKYLIDIAGDGTVLPAFMPNSKKLGEERVLVAENVANISSPIADNYRNRKLLERYYEAIAIRYELQLKDILVLCCIGECNIWKNRKELADYAEISLASLGHTLQKLIRKDYISIRKGKNCIVLHIKESGIPLWEEINKLYDDYNHVRFYGFSEEEIKEYMKYLKRIEENMRRVLN